MNNLKAATVKKIIVDYLKLQEKKIHTQVLDQAGLTIKSYQTATLYDRANMDNTILSTLQVIYQLLAKEELNNREFDNLLSDLGERRARQGVPLADVVGLFKILRETLLKSVKQVINQNPDMNVKTLLTFTSVLNDIFDRIDMRIVKQYIEIKDNIIQAQQSFLNHKFSSLFQLVESISNNLNIDEFCGHLLDYLNQFYDVKLSAFFLFDDKEQELYPQMVRGLSRRYQYEQRLSVKNGLVKKIVIDGKVVSTKDRPYAWSDITANVSAKNKSGEAPGGAPECSSLYAPLIGRQRIYGMVSLHSLSPKEYSQTEIKQFETLARIVTVAIENARFYQHLTEEKGKLDAIVNSVTDGFILIDFHEEIVFINEQASNYFQLPAYKLMGISASIIPDRLLQQAKDPYTVQSVYLRALANIADRPVINFTLYKPDLIDVRFTMFPVKDREHHLIGRGILIENISHENEINRMKSEFVALASHTMRTPMTSILGFASLLMEERLSEKTKIKYVTNIHKEAQRLTSVLNDMLEMANIEAGKIALKLNPVYLKSVVDRAVAMRQKETKDEIVLRNMVKKMPVILADEEKIEQALNNLIANAVKYANHSIVVTVKKTQTILFKKGWTHSHLDDRYVGALFPAIQISVEDNGPGIPLDQLDAIFEPFYRLPVEKQFVQEGSGLGLTIAKYSIEAHGGRIFAETKEGKGSLFTMILPIELSSPNKTIAGYDR